MSMQAITGRHQRGLLPFEIVQILDAEVNSEKFVKTTSDSYRAAVREFVLEKAVKKMGDVRQFHGMFEALEKDDEWGDEMDFTMGASQADVAAVDNKAKVTKEQLRTFLEICWIRYVKSRIEPGENPKVLVASYKGD